jgi:threonine efflux protein
MEMEVAAILVGIATVHLLAIASPGPTFVVVTSYAVAGDRRAGFLVTLGVLIATLTWASLAALGLGAVIAQFSWLYMALRLAGAAYLIYLGIKMLVGAARKTPVQMPQGARSASGWRAVRAGFLTNISNPKVIAYYSSLFGVMIPQDAPTWLFLAAAGTALVVSALWWSFVTLFFAIPLVRRGYARIRRRVDAVMGGILILLGGRLLISR